ncbi:hypothetical protein HL033_00885 [Neoehrlichia mikurensis]|uniref:Uncharacterized protein n=1 Tax=Neoehrlichia mikurensis TaxID=89586 RepID=A0A9Q9F3G3_9RICK|nr:hypothetical protein [Neoehrlichia mikurensis]QXK92124.1 hypothetical protein IAH97_00880 [Neoehrlichia mikurensis]QXK92581.1 hypothetical protein HUN61_00885 [Neoehrlichia mikurensis]QXK93818.1 hypothetical protein HL033_00885 [Neoehrlichia mikurensis]UTO55187.1 hypothetical protein LUA82_03245 [Neoehrlichia mikurensis]UTO56107.1 hypothetical protein LUA81_03220 [Neoehrlichia mikurensis]
MLITHIITRDSSGGLHGVYHSTLLRYKPGICAGTMMVQNGKITMIDIKSGHYTPAQENLFNAIKCLDKVIVPDAEVRSHSYTICDNVVRSRAHFENKESFLHRMETKGKDGLTIPERYFSYIRKCNKARLASLGNDRDSQVKSNSDNNRLSYIQRLFCRGKKFMNNIMHSLYSIR